MIIGVKEPVIFRRSLLNLWHQFALDEIHIYVNKKKFKAIRRHSVTPT